MGMGLPEGVKGKSTGLWVWKGRGELSAKLRAVAASGGCCRFGKQQGSAGIQGLVTDLPPAQPGVPRTAPARGFHSFPEQLWVHSVIRTVRY